MALLGVPSAMAAMARSLMSDSGHGANTAEPTSLVCEPGTIGYCVGHEEYGYQYEHVFLVVCQWLVLVMSLGGLFIYGYHTWKASCGWEEIYVTIIEVLTYVLEIWWGHYSPAVLTQVNGVQTAWLRYAEWLLTCPVILIHLSNLTGLKNNYSNRTMSLLVSDLGTIVFGITSAMSRAPLKIVFFVIGLCYGANTWFHAAKVYIEAFHSVPKGTCRNLVKFMAWLFFMSWTAFPILFLMGPEGFGHLTIYGSLIAHIILDMFSKNLWSYLGHVLRLQIHEYILKHGDIRQKKVINVAGEDMEIEEFVEEEDPAAGAVKQGTKQYANRASFLMMRDQMRARGLEVRASLDASQGDMLGDATVYAAPVPSSFAGSGKAGSALEPGRVVLGVLDPGMVDFFRDLFAGLPVPMEIVPALGADSVLQVASNALAFGGADCVLLHPEYLRERGPASLVGCLKASGHRVCAFGCNGQLRELVEGAGLDGWLEGPGWGISVVPAQLATLLFQMQVARRAAAMHGPMGAGTMAATTCAGLGTVPSLNRSMTSAWASATGAGSPRVNPLVTSTPGLRPVSPSTTLTGAVQQAPQTSGPSDADMMAQLMAEINRLKSELGE